MCSMKCHLTLLPASDKHRKFASLGPRSWKKRLFEDITDDLVVEVQFLALTLATGINDAVCFTQYGVFVSNQTGNTALLAVAVFNLGGEGYELSNIGISLGLFIIAGLLFGQLGNYFGRRRRFWLIFSNVVQTALMFAAAALRQWTRVTRAGPHAWSVISLMAFSSGAQVAMARTINLPEITTGMVTSAYIDFLVDQRIFGRHNRPRNRRGFFVLCLLSGSFIGASVDRYGAAALAMLLTSLFKAFVAISFLFNHSIPPESPDAKEDIEVAIQEDEPSTNPNGSLPEDNCENSSPPDDQRGRHDNEQSSQHNGSRTN